MSSNVKNDAAAQAQRLAAEQARQRVEAAAKAAATASTVRTAGPARAKGFGADEMSTGVGGALRRSATTRLGATLPAQQVQPSRGPFPQLPDAGSSYDSASSMYGVSQASQSTWSSGTPGTVKVVDYNVMGFPPGAFDGHYQWCRNVAKSSNDQVAVDGDGLINDINSASIMGNGTPEQQAQLLVNLSTRAADPGSNRPPVTVAWVANMGGFDAKTVASVIDNLGKNPGPVVLGTRSLSVAQANDPAVIAALKRNPNVLVVDPVTIGSPNNPTTEMGSKANPAGGEPQTAVAQALAANGVASLSVPMRWGEASDCVPMISSAVAAVFGSDPAKAARLTPQQFGAINAAILSGGTSPLSLTASVWTASGGSAPEALTLPSAFDAPLAIRAGVAALAGMP